MSEVHAKITFTVEEKEVGYVITAEKASSAVLISSVIEGKKCVNKAAKDAQKRAESTFDLT